MLISSCGSFRVESAPIEKTFSSDQITEIEIEIERGDLTIESSSDDQTHLVILGSGENNPIQLNGSKLSIDLSGSKSKKQIALTVAEDTDLTIRAFDGLIQINQIGGKIDIRSTAGDIELFDFSGSEATLWAGRGNILVSGGNGKAIVIGEHGELQVSSFIGPVSITTIMGDIQYFGDPDSNSTVNLEADHGPITAILPEVTDYQINVNTASGEVVCSGVELSYTVSGCKGVTGGGNERFNIRTVSGRIELKIPPGNGEK
jgi:DUF4097 and DUF4098 domain-containing protein YvlB